MSHIVKVWLAKRRHEVNKALPLLPSCPEPALPPIPQPCVQNDGSANSGFFTQLPRELRNAILEYAFGDRTVHMHLALEYPMQRKYRNETWTERHARIPPFYAMDNNLRPSWAWRSSVCHSICWGHHHWRRNARNVGDAEGCVRGNADCEDFKGEMCTLGAMGWLLSCRQAYLEGIDILYASNTIRLDGTFMMHRLPTLVSECHLNRIRKVVLSWDLDAGGTAMTAGQGFNPKDFHHAAGFLDLVETIPHALPNVQMLCIFASGWFWREAQTKAWSSPDNDMFALTEQLLEKLGETVSLFRSLEHARFYFPSSTILPWMQTVTDKLVTFDDCPAVDLPSDGVWREIAGSSSGGFWVYCGAVDLSRWTLWEAM